jgi:phosphoribosylformylglycinamidine cyclo-ligase
MYAKGDFDLAGFSVGAMERGNSLPAGVAEGDVLLGLASSGVHSNGYSLVRKIVEQSGLSWESPSPFSGESLGKALLTPTKLYVRSGLAAHHAGGLHALAHITGGGLTENLPRALPEGLGATVDLSAWTLPPVIKWLATQAGLDQAEMLKTFNCGIGMVAIAAPERADALISIFEDHGETVFKLGTVTKGAGIAYSGALA